MIGAKAKTSFDGRKLKKKSQDGSFKSLAHAGATIRRVAQRSIKRSKSSSKPGSPPKTRRGQLKKSILFGVEKHRQSAVIGPSANLISDVAAAHEHGREQQPRGTKGKTKNELLASGTNWKLMVGGHGPVPGRKQGTAYIRFRTREQVTASVRYIESGKGDLYDTPRARAAAMKRARLAGRPAKYPKRPFMGPALETVKPRLPKMWQNSVR